MSLRARRVVKDIEVDLQAAFDGGSSELCYIDGLVEAHLVAENSDERFEYLTFLGSRSTRDYFAAGSYLRGMLEPTYLSLPNVIREKYKPAVDELNRLVNDPEDVLDDEEDDGLP